MYVYMHTYIFIYFNVSSILKSTTPTQMDFFIDSFMFKPAMFTVHLALSALYFTVMDRH